MTNDNKLTLQQFESPWQGMGGMSRYTLSRETGEIVPTGTAKVKKMLRKGNKNLDGLVLKPAWPTRRGLVVLPRDGHIELYEMQGGKMVEASHVSTADPEFSFKFLERGLFRTFVFSDSNSEIVFRDFEARLLGPKRTAWEVTPTEDFSPFNRLGSILSEESSRSDLVKELEKRRFKYPAWVERTSRYAAA